MSDVKEEIVRAYSCKRLGMCTYIVQSDHGDNDEPQDENGPVQFLNRGGAESLKRKHYDENRAGATDCRPLGEGFAKATQCERADKHRTITL